MVNNRWLTGSLFLGLLIAVSLVSSIPMYTSGVMQKLLIKELEDYQIKTREFPGLFSYSDSFSSPKIENPAESFLKVEQLNKELTEDVGLPILAENISIGTVPLKVMYQDEARQEAERTPRDTKLIMLTGIEEQITLVDGRFPSEEEVNGVVEVLVTEEALQQRNMVLGTPFIVYNKDREVEFVVKPVGAFQQKAENSPYWSLIPKSLSEDFIVHENWFRNELLSKHEELLWIGRFSTAFDYHQITDSYFPTLLGLSGKITQQIATVKETDVLVNFPINGILKSYEKKVKQMTTMLWSLNVPVLIMLALYLYMISRLIVSRQLNEIAVFFSRGASRWQILLIYFIEALLLGLIALGLGPLIGLQLGKILGASNGFLEFVQRSLLPIELSKKAYLYGVLTVITSIIMIMIPVFRASGQSIVHHKQRMARNVGKMQWTMMIFEFGLLGFSVYELVKFNNQRAELIAFNIDSADLMMDPKLFFLPALFIIGFALVALRIYPWILKALFKLGEKLLPLPLYSTFLQVSRASKQYQFLMMFLIMTIGMGVFSASAARTINTNLEEQLLYNNGAEVRLQQRWTSNLPPPLPPGMGGPEEETKEEMEIEEVVYTEPPFDPIANLKQVESTAKVFRKNRIDVMAGDRSIRHGQLMAIETKDFGETAWFKESLLPHHWYYYLNLISKEPSAILLSKHTADELKVGPGDTVSLSWNGSDTGEFIVYGLVDYWPAFNPLEKDAESKENVAALIVANLPYVQTMLGLEPYEVWMKLKPGSSRAEFYNDIEEAKIPVQFMSDVVPKVTELKNSALLLGVNGAMTLGFFISLLISFIGFLLYWILTMKSRTLQYGIFRAMGISLPKIITMLITEQIFTSGIACLLGMIIGGVTSLIYVPLFKLSLNIEQMMPPFAAVSDASDETKIYIFTAIMLIVGSAILIGFLRKIKIDQAIKLGED
ncbi:ABC transporter permease [Bacillus niameyensis]|uniref:ABC transporter permease n=1 Tax=Bacillus niameyensis TaxID=1522308 RepID=UPI000B019F7F|nr:ABC transporter permease [Bacillus niameyensis]